MTARGSCAPIVLLHCRGPAAADTWATAALSGPQARSVAQCLTLGAEASARADWLGANFLAVLQGDSAFS